VYEILRRDLSQWRRIRAELWSAAEVRAVATKVASGDWRAAAALVDTDVEVDLDDVRRRFGATAAAAIEDDLHHLRLDLLWWHLPRHRGGRTTLLPRVSAVLGPDEGADTAVPGGAGCGRLAPAPVGGR
jgi:hypothetical protein